MLGRTAPELVTLEKPFCGAPAGAKMLVANPKLVKEYVESIPPGDERTIREMRSDLAKAHGAEIACPTSTSIFLRIVAEAALETSRSEEDLPPFWRVIRPEDVLAQKLSCGPDFVREMRAREGLA